MNISEHDEQPVVPAEQEVKPESVADAADEMSRRDFIKGAATAAVFGPA